METTAYSRQLERLGVTETEKGAIYDQYARDPAFGAVVRSTGGLRKGRIAKDRTGKSGGYRVFSFFADRENPVFLLWIIDKTREATLTSAQENGFRVLTAALKAECK